MKLKKHKKNKKYMILVYIVILAIIFSIILISYFNKKATPILINYAESEIKKITTTIINESINKEEIDKMDINNLFEITKNSNEEIELINYNSYNVTEFLNTVTNQVQHNLKLVEDGKNTKTNLLEDYDEDLLDKGIIYEIPLGVVFNNSFLSNLGPKIPVRLSLVSNVTSNIETKITEYGINNVMIEVFIKIEVDGLINIPFITKNVKVNSNMPISTKIVQGKIPSYYSGGINTKSDNFELNS